MKPQLSFSYLSGRIVGVVDTGVESGCRVFHAAAAAFELQDANLLRFQLSLHLREQFLLPSFKLLPQLLHILFVFFSQLRQLLVLQPHS